MPRTSLAFRRISDSWKTALRITLSNFGGIARSRLESTTGVSPASRDTGETPVAQEEIMSESLIERLFSLKGRTALVTGASGGIGRALARGLAGAGASVAVHGRNVAEMEATC